ncbi:hypothetical protein BV372_23080 [Nostoc sp. T09]|uniref:hypothetical protein n=1 Tax=Nostoc sp. T09 TaxID=1932621 RepID=UPI000A3AC94D|nr:hypothetical protein [Nostoc sp. T09]OUL29513.1 hypothetical protein BV372_23080 [Nostoc sp. T09]
MRISSYIRFEFKVQHLAVCSGVNSHQSTLAIDYDGFAILCRSVAQTAELYCLIFSDQLHHLK